MKSPKRREIISVVFTCLCITKSLFTIYNMHEYKIMTRTTDLNYDDIHFLDIKIRT